MATKKTDKWYPGKNVIGAIQANKENKRETKVEIVKAKEATKVVAYENKIDPNAAKYNAIASLGESAANFGTSALGKGNQNISAQGDNKIVMYFVGALLFVLAIFGFKSKR